jgi:hypothetical protein
MIDSRAPSEGRSRLSINAAPVFGSGSADVITAGTAELNPPFLEETGRPMW